MALLRRNKGSINALLTRYESVQYLNDVKRGGTTSFGKLNLTVNPQKGQVLFFLGVFFK